MGFIETGGIAAQSGTSGPCELPSPSGPGEGRYPGLFGSSPPVVVSIKSVPYTLARLTYMSCRLQLSGLDVVTAR
jgi:hypothetical protein